MQRIQNLATCIRYLRETVGTAVTLQQIDVLITVAVQEGITQPEIGEQLAMPQGTVSKNIRILSLRMVKSGTGHVPKGLDLITVRPDLYDARRHAVFLTPKGEALMRQIDRILETGIFDAA